MQKGIFMKITYREMIKEDISKVTPLYKEYWNSTGDNWNDSHVYRRIWQVLGSPDSFCLIAENEDKAVGFAMGRFESFYDITCYDLVEVIIAKEFQSMGIGSELMKELEAQVNQKGASVIQLICEKDQMHEHFYSKLGYIDSKKLAFKSKVLNEKD